MTVLLALAAAAAPAAFVGSDRAALDLAIAITRYAPPDLKPLIVEHRADYLRAAREAARKAPAANLAAEAGAVASAVTAHVPFSEIVRRCGTLVGELLAIEAPTQTGALAPDAFETACRGPYRFFGVTPAAARGDVRSIAQAVASSRERALTAGARPDDVASRAVTDGTNLLWTIWIGAGGDRRPATKFDERNGPYAIDAAPR